MTIGSAASRASHEDVAPLPTFDSQDTLLRQKSEAALLEGVDMIVFTGGIGENDGESRAAICRRLAWMGIRLDEARNGSGADPIGNPASRCAVRVLASREDDQIARHTWELIAKSRPIPLDDAPPE